MKANNRYTVTGGEQVIITGEKCGRLVVEGKNLFFIDDGTKQPIVPSDILRICITSDWFGVLALRGLKFLLDARIYVPRKVKPVA